MTDTDSTFYLGLDLGQAQDNTALAIVEETTRTEIVPAHEPSPLGGVQLGDREETRSTYALRHVERFELGTSYPDVVTAMVDYTTVPALRAADWILVVDATGVGRPVVDMLQERDLDPWSIFITGGDSVTKDGQEMRVPKRELASVLQALLQNGRLKFAAELPFREVLQEELQTFKAKINIDTGHASFEHWRESDTDDIVLALAMAVWFADRAPIRSGGGANIPL